jgi:hypothetical protein
MDSTVLKKERRKPHISALHAANYPPTVSNQKRAAAKAKELIRIIP